MLEDNLKGLRDKVCSSYGITSIRISSRENLCLYTLLRVLKLFILISSCRKYLSSSKRWCSPAGGKFNQSVSGYNKALGYKKYIFHVWSLSFLKMYTLPWFGIIVTVRTENLPPKVLTWQKFSVSILSACWVRMKQMSLLQGVGDETKCCKRNSGLR